MSLKLSKYIVCTDVINPNENPDMQTRILYSTISNVTIGIKTPILENILDGKLDGIDRSIKTELENANILVPSERDEFSVILAENKSPDGSLSFVLNTSANCGLGCTYCGQNHVNEEITDAVKNRLGDYIENKLSSGKFSFFNVVWDGAEPLMGLQAIIELSDKNIVLSKKYHVPYRAGIVTNGATLTKDIFEILFFECAIKNFHITLDGNKDYHDSKRKTKDGSPTFNLIFNNIKHILEQVAFLPRDGIIFEIRVNIDKLNHESVFDLIDIFSAHKFQNRVTFKFSPVANYAGNKSRDISGYQMEAFAELEIEYLLYAIQKGFTQSILPARALVPCLAVAENSTSIDIYGNMFSCNALPYTVHELSEPNKIGNLLSGKESPDKKTLFRNWFNQIDMEKGVCYSCNLFPVCGGGCRLKWGEGEDGCPSFKYNIEDRLILNYINQKDRLNGLITEE